MIFPLYWMVVTSLKSDIDVQSSTMSWWPSAPMWGNYVKTFTALPFGRWTLNTIEITVLTIVGAVISNALIAYGFSRFKVRERSWLFMIVLATMMLPGAVTMIPKFILFRDLGWLNTYLPLIVPSFFGSAFFIFLLRQFFMTIPIELEEAARIDGLGPFAILLRIILPLTLPALTTLAIFQFNGAWNDFMGPLIYLSDLKTYTLSLGINFFKGANTTQYNYLMAASVVSLIPSVVIFFVGQKYFIEGISLSSGIK